jgi:integrase
MQKDKLTELTIKQAKPREKEYKLSDGGGLYLLVHPRGSSFGVWPEMSLAVARKARDEARIKIKNGINPIEEKKEYRRDIREKIEKKDHEEKQIFTTFERVALDWYRRQASQWTEKHSADVFNSLSLYVFPVMGNRPISDISKQDVIATLRKIEAEGKHETCYRARQRIEAIFDYAEVEEHPSITPKEFPELLHKIADDDSAFPPTKLAMKFMILTFVRTKELRFAEWKEFNLDCEEPLWIVPADKMKMRKTHHVPLAPQTVKILDEMRQFSGPDGYLFPQIRNPKKAISENDLLYYLYRLGYRRRHTVHGFRSLADTMLNESRKWHPDVIELQLAHQEQNKVRRAYNRAEHLDERRKMMLWWADHVDSLMIPADVIDLHSARKRRA